MKPIFFLALVFLAFTVANVRAEDSDGAGPRITVFRAYGMVRNFFSNDPLGQKIGLQLRELGEIALELRKRLRQRLGSYLKELQKEN
ncbi:unnamed protein product [Rodentolepis nana]|uniref:Secreted protein n=1 Tax=Rodentolepis nana TaxID=102285 RepID=A0A0R3T3R2_RODNA|nr:unnamed protein product [Rodentolepis nana]